MTFEFVASFKLSIKFRLCIIAKAVSKYSRRKL